MNICHKTEIITTVQAIRINIYAARHEIFMGTEKGGPVRQELIYIGLGLPAGLMFKDG